MSPCSQTGETPVQATADFPAPCESSQTSPPLPGYKQFLHRPKMSFNYGGGTQDAGFGS